MDYQDRIRLQNMRFYGRHGVHPEERRLGQPFAVDIEIFTDLRAAGTSDDLHQTIHYGEVYRLVKRIVEKESFYLIEALAERIAHDLLQRFPIPTLLVRVRKPHAPLPGPFDYVEVEIRRQRSEVFPRGRGKRA
ncbi:MAG: dihydroneopterin aldolase [Nitrospinota bacterium]|nr:MAG: dihydroneopterin aldolase [Nitrospinota bacterium]